MEATPVGPMYLHLAVRPPRSGPQRCDPTLYSYECSGKDMTLAVPGPGETTRLVLNSSPMGQLVSGTRRYFRRQTHPDVRPVRVVEGAWLKLLGSWMERMSSSAGLMSPLAVSPL